MKNAKRTPDYYANVPNVGAPGTPGKWRFPDKAPKDLAELIAKTTDGDVVADPKTRWADGEYVPLGDGSKVRWDGTTWLLLAPVLDHIEPTSHIEKSYFDLELRGANFVDKAKVKFGASDRDATCHSADHLTVAVTKNDTAATYDIQVINPDGQRSGTKSLELKAEEKPKPPPRATIDHISPTKHEEKSVFTLHVSGKNFIDKDANSPGKESIVEVKDKDGMYHMQPTTFQDTEHLSAEIGVSFDACDSKVCVRNGKGATQVYSNEIDFKFTAAHHPPHISSIDPEEHVEGASFPLVVRGDSFNKDATIYAGSGVLNTGWKSATRLETTIPDDWSVGDHTITVKEAGEPISNEKTLTITRRPAPPPPPPKPQPHIDRLAPNSVVEDSDATIRIVGSHIDPHGTLWIDHNNKNDLINSIGLPVSFVLSRTWGYQGSPKEVYWENTNGDRSNTVELYIHQKELKPAPHIDSLAPPSAVEQEPFTLEIHGENFREGAQAGITGADGNYSWAATTFHDAGHISRRVEGHSPGDRKVWVWNPGGDIPSNKSNEVPYTFTEGQPTPHIERIELRSGGSSIHITGRGLDLLGKLWMEARFALPAQIVGSPDLSSGESDSTNVDVNSSQAFILQRFNEIPVYWVNTGGKQSNSMLIPK